MRAALGVMLGSAVLTVVCAVSCSAFEPATKYGDPAGARKENLPGEAGVEALVCPGDAGAPSADGGCGVSWSADIFPKMVQGSGGWECANSACHGPRSNQPPIIAADAGAALAALKAYTLPARGAITYINDKSTDPDQSSITCNLGASCGSAMPIGAGRPPTTAERCLINAWIACGSPAN